METFTSNATWISRPERLQVLKVKNAKNSFQVDTYICMDEAGNICHVSRKEIVTDLEVVKIKKLAKLLTSPNPGKNPEIFQIIKYLVRNSVPYLSILEIELNYLKNKKLVRK